jgi:YHS domain-containing protein
MLENDLRPLKLFFLVVAIMLPFNSFVYAEDVLNSLDKNSFGLAIKGYDAVAYFTDNKAIKGNEKYTYSWNEAVWHFSSAEHRELFAANPKKYVPHRGGW